MKMRDNILILVLALFGVVACTNDGDIVDFKTDVNTLEVEAYGGVQKVRVSSSDEWVASVSMQSD